MKTPHPLSLFCCEGHMNRTYYLPLTEQSPIQFLGTEQCVLNFSDLTSANLNTQIDRNIFMDAIGQISNIHFFKLNILFKFFFGWGV